MTNIYLHTIGDSSLDNAYWLLDDRAKNAVEAKNSSVEGKLQTKLGSRVRVISHAYDGFTTSSVLHGDDVGRVLDIRRSARQSLVNKAYLQNRGIRPEARSYRVLPLQDLKRSIESAPDARHYVVISVGGNDFRENLHPAGLHRLILDIPKVHERYLKIVQEIKSIKGDVRPILMFQYRPDARTDRPYHIYTALKVIAIVSDVIKPIWGALSSLLGAGGFAQINKFVPISATMSFLQGKNIGMSLMGALMEKFYSPILEYAKKERIPILDLPNTFNPYKALYTCQIEPNSEGGELIAEGISHIVKNHRFDKSPKSDTSMLYSKWDGASTYSATENPGASGWKVRYPTGP